MSSAMHLEAIAIPYVLQVCSFNNFNDRNSIFWQVFWFCIHILKPTNLHAFLVRRNFTI